MTREFRSSEYKYTTASEMIISGIGGPRTRLEIRTRKNQEIYRPAHKTVATRERKKLLDKENWYKGREQDTEQLTETTNTKYHNKKQQTSWG